MCQTVIIHHEALDNEFPKLLRCPYSELCPSDRVHAITDRDNHIKIVVGYFSGNLTPSFVLNYPEFPDSCVFLKLLLAVYILNVFVDRTYVLLKKIRHVSLAQPQGLVLMQYFEAGFTVFSLIQQYLIFCYWGNFAFITQ